MRHRKWIAATLMAGALSQPACAEDLVDPAAIQALQAMGAHLAKLQTFALTSQTQMEVVLDDEQKLLVGGTVEYQVQRPDRLRIDLKTDVAERQLYYDGKSVSYVSPADGYYALIENAPTDIKSVLDYTSETYALDFPAADLFEWGTEDEPVDLVKEAFKVGTATIDGTVTDHWAFRTETQDWEIWLRTDGTSLPERISIVDREDTALPRFVADYSWDEGATPDASAFIYQPPEGAKRIDFLETELSTVGETEAQ
ncbi:DUF2092 domain-containing protein [Paracoccus aestuariivivens]|uniref:DUF2092 domain-containing protein n=1 Tax=Paracoccus aestuariivivens TaxID=1820333 RepID=A0A6L6JA78_9RHOB|nr:DUF2092 domain-containing protein [Paracoccus aestuariivivens]MTH78456.1 DUF2092 domain-containing protein [Paracoccus aestuariivivens]